MGMYVVGNLNEAVVGPGIVEGSCVVGLSAVGVYVVGNLNEAVVGIVEGSVSCVV